MTLPAQSLSSSGEGVISRDIEDDDQGDEDKRLDVSIEEQYELERIKKEIEKLDAKRVALQFPDALLKDSRELVTLIRSACQVEVFVLADTSYGSCCVDEIAASHIEPDLIVHFGKACLTKTSRYPTLYILPKWPLNQEQMKAAAKAMSEAAKKAGRPVVFLYDLVYTWKFAEMLELLKFELETPGHLNIDLSKSSQTTMKSIQLPTATTSLEECTLLWLGGDSRSLRNIVLTNASSEIYSFDPRSMQLTRQSNANKMLARRYVKMQQIRDSSVIGIVMGTLTADSYLDIVNDLLAYIKRSGRKSYLFAMGKLNPAKMANFAEIESWVLIGCPGNTLIDSKEFYKPIVTPFECVVALSEDAGHVDKLEWNGQYALDFGQIIKLINQRTHRGPSKDEEAHFSIITGTYRSKPSHHVDHLTDAADQLTLRNNDSSLARLDGNRHLENRLFQGLELQAGTPVAEITEGRSGMARGYGNS